MKNVEIINVLVAELLNANSEFEKDINETVSNLSKEAAESVALIAYLNGTDSELEKGSISTYLAIILFLLSTIRDCHKHFRLLHTEMKYPYR